MNSIPNFANISTGNFSVLAAGGYILKMISVKDVPDKEYFEVVYDIAEGPEKGRYSDDWGQQHPYTHRFVRSYKEKAISMFKGFITAVEDSNNVQLQQKCIDGSLSAKDLQGLLLGAVIAYEEYRNDRGEVKQRSYIASIKSVEDIKEGHFTIPDVKKLKEEASSSAEGFTPFTDQDLPF